MMNQMMMLFIATACVFVAVQAQAPAPAPQRAEAPQQAEWLATHNRARSAEGAGLVALTWSTPAYEFALAYAQKQAALPGCPFQHSRSPTYGENLYWSSDDNSDAPTGAVNSWYAEKPNWDFASKSCPRGVCGHYTQVVWNATTSVGCAAVLVPKWTCVAGYPGGKFAICNYYPRGNYIGQNPY